MLTVSALPFQHSAEEYSICSQPGGPQRLLLMIPTRPRMCPAAKHAIHDLYAGEFVPGSSHYLGAVEG